jgi:scyllo-inositol 2-dehydrogenase (NADP+)
MKVNLGVIGFGWMAYYHYQKIIPKEADFAMVAAYDIDPKRREFVKNLGLKAYDSLDDFLHDNSFENVLVAVPNNFHHEMVVKALEAGKNVICEKPVSMNAAEVADMIAVSKRVNRIFTVHQNRRRDRDFQSVRKVISDGTLGTPFLIESRIDGANGIPSDWRRKKESGGGMLLDWGSHLIDQLLYLIPGSVVQVYAQLQNIAYNVDDNLRVLLKFDNGLCALIEVCTTAFIPLPRWHILGTKGTMDIKNLEGEGKIIVGTVQEIDWSLEAVNRKWGESTRTMRPRPEDTIRELPVPQFENDYQEFYYNFKRVLEGKEELLINPEETLRVMKLIDTAFESGRTGKSISCRI